PAAGVGGCAAAAAGARRSAAAMPAARRGAAAATLAAGRPDRNRAGASRMAANIRAGAGSCNRACAPLYPWIQSRLSRGRAGGGPCMDDNETGEERPMAGGSRAHGYEVSVRWTGNRGAGTATYAGYDRAHEIRAEGKPVLPGSSDLRF